MEVPVIVTYLLLVVSCCNGYVVYDEISENQLCCNITLIQQLNQTSKHKLQALCKQELVENYDGQLATNIQKYLTFKMLKGKNLNLADFQSKVEIIQAILNGIKNILSYWVEGIFKHSLGGMLTKPKTSNNSIAIKETDFLERFMWSEFDILKEIFINWEGVYDDINEEIVNFINTEFTKIRGEKMQNNTEKIEQIKRSSNQTMNKAPKQNILKINGQNSSHNIYGEMPRKQLCTNNTFMRSLNKSTKAEVRLCCKKILAGIDDGELIAIIDIMPCIEKIMESYSNRITLTSEMKELTLHITNGVKNILEKYSIDKLMQAMEKTSNAWPQNPAGGNVTNEDSSKEFTSNSNIAKRLESRMQNPAGGNVTNEDSSKEFTSNSNIPKRLESRMQILKGLLQKAKEDFSNIRPIIIKIHLREQLEVTKNPKSKLRKQLQNQMHEWLSKHYQIYRKIQKIEDLIGEIEQTPLTIQNFKIWMKHFMVKDNHCKS